MDIDQLTKIVKKKIEDNLSPQFISIKDKTFLHEKHRAHTKGKFHIKILIKSKNIENMSKIEKTRLLYNVLKIEIKNYIHSIEIEFN